MANPAWPESLPNPLVDNCAYASADDNVVRSQFSGGIKVRRRYSHVPEVVTFDLHLTRAQAKTLYDFVVTTLGDVGLFDWVEHRDPALGAATYRFRQRPRFVPAASGLEWRATISLDLLTPFSGSFDLGDLLNNDDEIITT